MLVSIDDSTRHQLVVLARRPRSRDTKFSAERPTEWRPHEVRNPAVDVPFSNPAAWELIASRLEDGHDVKVITLDNPRGKPGYVMKIELEPRVPRLYVKLQLHAGRIFGRSFHYSTRE